MSQHAFEPGKLVAGLVVLGTGVAYGLDADGVWRVPPFLALPVVVVGLFLAGGVSVLSYLLRRGRRTERGALSGGPGAAGAGGPAVPGAPGGPGAAGASGASGAAGGPGDAGTDRTATTSTAGRDRGEA